MKIYLIEEPFGIDNLKIAERPIPESSSTQVLIKGRAVSLNYRDLLEVI